MKRFPIAALVMWCAVAAGAAPGAGQEPVIFVHGNGDDATKWIPTMWLFETNGYARERLFAIRLTDPVARRADSKAEPFRSSTTDQAAELGGFVTRVLVETRAAKVVLVGSSRGGLTIRNYVKNGGGRAVVRAAVLCGTPNHGVVLNDEGKDQEFNGKGDFLRGLNAGGEVVEGVRFLTIRSDRMDKFAQEGVGVDGPALAGAENVVLAGLDHREVAFHRSAFEVMYRFLTGQAARRLEPEEEAAPMVSGVITAMAGVAPTNRPEAGVRVRLYAQRPGTAEREGAALYEGKTDGSGTWGPVRVEPKRGYEVELEQGGRRVTYYLSGLARSTRVLNFRMLAPARTGGVLVHRPQGYLAQGRDRVLVNGAEAAGLPPAGVPTRDSFELPAAGPVKVELRGEVIHARPAEAAGDVSVAWLMWD